MHPPRLVFKLGASDGYAEFFMIAFSGSRRKMRLINSPDTMGQQLSEVLRERFPRRILSATWDEQNIYKIEFRREGFDRMSDLDLTIFCVGFDLVASIDSWDLLVAEILEATHNHGYKLDASIPLRISGLLGLVQGRREVWIFRRVQSHRRKSSGA